MRCEIDSKNTGIAIGLFKMLTVDSVQSFDVTVAALLGTDEFLYFVNVFLDTCVVMSAKRPVEKYQNRVG